MIRISFKKGLRVYALAIVLTMAAIVSWIGYFLFTFFTLPSEDARSFFIWGVVVTILQFIMFLILCRDVVTKERRLEKKQLREDRKAEKLAASNAKRIDPSDPEIVEALAEE